MIAYILLFLLLLNSSTFYSIIFNKKIEQTIFLSIFSYIAILFVFGVFNVLNIGYYCILCLNVIALLFNVYKLVKNRDLFNNILTPGLVFFILTYLFILYVSVGRQVSIGDEFSHWGTKVKNLYYLNTVNVTKETTLWYDYLSGSSIFNYFCTKLSGYYNESMLYIGQNLIITSMFLPITSIFKKRKLINYIIYPFVILLPTIVFREVYASLYVDSLLGICLGYNIYSYILNKDDDNFKLVNTICGLSMLVFIKDSGMLFAVLIFIMINVHRIAKFNKKKIWKLNKWYFLSIIPAVALNYAWKFALNINNAMDSFGKSKMFGNILSLFKLDLLPYQKDTILNFIRALGTEVISNTRIELSFLSLFAIIAFLGYIIINHSKEKEDAKDKKMIVYSSIAIIIIFAVGLLSLYLTSFSEYEATRVASFPRYMATSIEGVGLAFIVILIIDFYNNPKLINKLMLSLFMFYALFYNYEVGLDTTIFARNKISETKQLRESYSEINRLNSVLNKDDKLYLISIADKGGDLSAAHYILTPIKVNESKEGKANWSIGKPYYEGDIWTRDISVEDIRKIILRDYTYVFIQRSNEEFEEIYRELFIDEIEEKALYKVVKSDDNAILKKVDI